MLWSDLDEATADRAIAAEVARFAGRGRWEWKLYSYDAPSDLAERLLAAGFVAEDEETLLVGEIAALPPAAPMPDGVRLVDVEDEAGIAAFLHVGEDVFGDHDIAFGEQLLGDIRAGRSAAVVAVVGDRPISSGRIEFYDGTDFAGLYGGATVADWRRRGIFRAVVAHRAGLARARGVRYLQTDASDDSRPIFLRLGFRAIATTTPYIHD